ncbi:hypothetical protein [Streptomyces spongiae]|nr:hypothetical protein [Streptomyces spongiae]
MPQGLGVLRELTPDHLQSDGLPASGAGEVDAAHPTLTELLA